MTRCTWGWTLLQQYVITFCETLRMDIIATVRNNFLWNHCKICPCGVKSGNWISFYKCIFVWYITRRTLLPNLWRLHFHRLLATTITYRFCLLVRIKSENGNWKLHSCFHAFPLCDIYTGMVTSMLQCYKNAWSYYLGPWIMGNFPSYCMHQEYFLIRRWSLQWKGCCHWEHSCALMAEQNFCHIWTIMCKEYDTQSVCQGQLNLIFKNLFSMITEWSPTLSPKHSNIVCSLRQYIPALSCSVHVTRTVWKKTDCKMKCKFSRRTFQQPDLWATYTDSDVRSNVESDFHSPKTQWPISH
jgi:hypothetical protein